MLKPEKLTETELIKMLVNNERQGYEYLYDNYNALLYATINRIIKDEDIAADVLQDAFVKIWRNIAQYDAKRGKLFTWMINICRNEAIDKARSKIYAHEHKRRSIEESLSEIDAKVTYCLKHEYIDLSGFVDKLAHKESFLVNLMYFHGYSQAEISNEHNIPLGTVKSRFRDATANLRKILAE